MEKERIPNHDLLLIDWFSLRVCGMEPEELVELLGMTDAQWEQFNYGHNGYRKMMTSGGVSINWDGHNEKMGCLISMSGQGCRHFETYGHGDWTSLLRFALSDPDNNKLTRLDAAYDDHTGVLDLNRLLVDTDQQFYVSRSRSWEITYGSSGRSLYFGSKQSDMLIRIYDKAAERGFDPDQVHWLRVELQMRDNIAQGFAEGFLCRDFSYQFCGVLRRYLRFCEPVEGDSNKSRWPSADYWENFLQSAEAIRCWSAPGVEYNLENLGHMVDGVRNGLLTYIQIFGVDGLIDYLRSNFDFGSYPKKYKKFISDRKSCNEYVKYDSLMDFFSFVSGWDERVKRWTDEKIN